MARITERENYLMLSRGEVPHWVPKMSYGYDKNGTYPEPTGMIFSSVIPMQRGEPGKPYKDYWGIEYTPTVETGGAALPTPGRFILEDITKWHEVVKAPDLTDVDWELVCKRDLDNLYFDRNETALTYGTHVGYFQLLMNFMGFTEGLCAMYEEPDAVKEFMEYLCDFFSTITENTIDYYKPDIFNCTDDMATANDPFISVEMYRDLVKPFHARQCNIAADRGIPVAMHNCGRCEDYILDWMDFGVKYWDPAQYMNDLVAVKEKFWKEYNFSIVGGFDLHYPAGHPSVTEDSVREEVRRLIDTLAPGGGYVFAGGAMVGIGDTDAERVNRWIFDEVDTYGRNFYNK